MDDWRIWISPFSRKEIRFGTPEEIFFAVVEIEDDISFGAMSGEVPYQFHCGDSSHSVVLGLVQL